MSSQYKPWSQLGLSTALAVSLIGAGCSAAETETDIRQEAPAPVASSQTGEGEAGESGEGEGGVSIAQAATDPVVFLSALAITEAHFLAGRDAYAAGFTEAAAEMFAHPVSEVLADMESVFQARGVNDFTNLLLDASDAAYSGASQSDIDGHVDAVIAALRSAAERAPDNGMTEGQIAIRVAADQIDRAADMYGVAQGSDAYEPYLDGYGFYKAAQEVFESSRATIQSSSAETIPVIQSALDGLARAYPSATRPDDLSENSAQLTAMAARVLLALN